MMHFYPFHLAEYAAHTRHLSLMEDLAYRRLLDRYYLDEAAPMGSVEAIARLLGMRGEVEAVASVLAEFFVETPDGWVNARAERELEAYRRRQENQAAAGRASAAARARKTDLTNSRSTDVEQRLNGGSTDVEQRLNDRSTIKTKTKTKTTDPLSRTRGEERARAETPPTPASLPASPAGLLAHPAPEPPSPTSAQAIAPPGSVPGASAPVGAPPSPEEILGAWSEAGLPPAQRHEVELLLDRAIRLRPGRDLAWCRAFFGRIAASPWCRGEVHSHPGSREWTLDYALGSERRISEVMAGRYDDRPATKAGPRGGEGGRPGKRFSIFDAPQEDAVLFSIDRTRKAKASAPRAEKRDGDGEWVEAPERKRLGSGGERR